MFEKSPIFYELQKNRKLFCRINLKIILINEDYYALILCKVMLPLIGIKSH
jgi:hypothetical protein